MADQNSEDEQAVHTVPEEQAQISPSSADGDEESIEADPDLSDQELDSASDDGVHGLEHESQLETTHNGAQEAAPPDQPAGPPKNWYIIHAYSGFEQKVAES